MISTSKEMPKLDKSKLELTPQESRLFDFIVNPRTQCLRATPPSKTALNGAAYYLWRMTAFMVSPHPRHHCMPYTADLYLFPPFGSLERKALIRELKTLEDKVLTLINKEDHHGINKYARIYGGI